MEKLIETIPLIIALIVPPVFAMVKGALGNLIPEKAIPVVLPIGGGILAGLASLVGVDASLLATISHDPSTWETVVQGILAGSAAVGIHQIKKQAEKPDGGGTD
jgi:hypothetical protein